MENLLGRKVKTYRNLNNGKWSIKTDKVAGYADKLVMEHITFTGAHTKAQAKIQAGEHRSVHAYAQGTLLQIDPVMTSYNAGPWSEVSYHPKIKAGFYEVTTGREVIGAAIAIFRDSKVFCAGVIYV